MVQVILNTGETVTLDASCWTFTTGDTVEVLDEDNSIVAEFNRDGVLYVRHDVDNRLGKLKLRLADGYRARATAFGG